MDRDDDESSQPKTAAVLLFLRPDRMVIGTGDVRDRDTALARRGGVSYCRRKAPTAAQTERGNRLRSTPTARQMTDRTMNRSAGALPGRAARLFIHDAV